MTPSLIDRRPRSELVAELYDRHAAGLFAYCHDQLGDPAAASDALACVLANVPDVEPPRAALYALARREIYRRDVTYVFPSVDASADPATAMVERVVRDIRPHQREVLLLSAVCGLDTAELAQVLDVAADTAEQLVVSARHRFTHSLAAALSATRSGTAVPPRAAEAYDALSVTPTEESLGRLPWRVPPPALRGRILSSLPEEPVPATADRQWPTTPRWPLPLAEPNPFTDPAEELRRSKGRRKSKHEATTGPMPKLRAPGSGHRLPPVAPTTPPGPSSARFVPPEPPGEISAFVQMFHADAAPPAPPAPADVRTPSVPPSPSPSDTHAPAGPRPHPHRGRPAAEKSSSFSRALDNGNWPTLRRTFSAAGPPAVAADPTSGGSFTAMPERASDSRPEQGAGDAVEKRPGHAKVLAAARARAVTYGGTLATLATAATTALRRLPAEARARFAAKATGQEAAARPVGPAEPEDRRDLAPPAFDLAQPAREPAPPARDLAPPARQPAPPARDLAPPARQPASSARHPAPPGGDLAELADSEALAPGEVTGPMATIVDADWPASAAVIGAGPGATVAGGAEPEGPLTGGARPGAKAAGAGAEPKGSSVAGSQAKDATVGGAPKGAVADGAEPKATTAPGGVTRPLRHDRLKPIKLREHHYDWLWEVAGFVLCVAIAMIVFFAMPMISTP